MVGEGSAPADGPPASLHVTTHGRRLRAQIRLAPDEGRLRRLGFSAIAAMLVMALVNNVPAGPEITAMASMGAFLALVLAMWNLIRLVNLPQTVELDDLRLEIADDAFPLPDVATVLATPDPLQLVVVLRDGIRHVYFVNDRRHAHADLAWLAARVRDRLAGQGAISGPGPAPSG